MARAKQGRCARAAPLSFSLVLSRSFSFSLFLTRSLCARYYVVQLTFALAVLCGAAGEVAQVRESGGVPKKKKGPCSAPPRPQQKNGRRHRDTRSTGSTGAMGRSIQQCVQTKISIWNKILLVQARESKRRGHLASDGMLLAVGACAKNVPLLVRPHITAQPDDGLSVVGSQGPNVLFTTPPEDWSTPCRFVWPNKRHPQSVRQNVYAPSHGISTTTSATTT